MSTKDEVCGYLQTGYTPKSIIGVGFKKSTVYKVFQDVETFSGHVRKPDVAM